MTDQFRGSGLKTVAPGIVVVENGNAIADPGRYRLVLTRPCNTAGVPAVFGDGSHPTTRLCAAALASLCTQNVPAAVLDVGTGTGLLARIARALGASFVVGTDIDPQALRFAAASVALDAGPNGDIVLSDAAPDTWGPRFDLVVANILESPLDTLAPAIVGALRPPGAVLLLSGFTRAQAPRLRVRYEMLGLRCTREAVLEGWVLLMFVRPRTAAVL